EPVVATDSPGFIVNRLARPYYLEALRLHAEGVSVADCDAAMRAAGFPMGPFELLDLIGLDVNLASSISVYRAFFEEPRYRPHPLQQRMVAAGRLGRKTGEGFYRYDEHGRRVGAPSTVDPTSAAVEGHHEPLEPGFHVIGTGVLAATLRAHLPAATEGRRPAVTFDTRLSADAVRDPGPQRGDLVATLAWARSAASAASGSPTQEDPASRPAPAVLGFSFVPGKQQPERLTIELLVPAAAGAADAARQAAAALSSAG